jgi:hypothetical protein
MKVRHLKTAGAMDLAGILRAARKLFRGRCRRPMLVAWYDRGTNTGGPLEVCAGQPFKCALDYAASRGAETRMVVNGRQFELFFSPTPSDTLELDREMCLEIHRELDQDRLQENVMGG